MQIFYVVKTTRSVFNNTESDRKVSPSQFDCGSNLIVFLTVEFVTVIWTRPINTWFLCNYLV